MASNETHNARDNAMKTALLYLAAITIHPIAIAPVLYVWYKDETRDDYNG